LKHYFSKKKKKKKPQGGEGLWDRAVRAAAAVLGHAKVQGLCLC
jgi:hypothetical protein